MNKQEHKCTYFCFLSLLDKVQASTLYLYFQVPKMSQITGLCLVLGQFPGPHPLHRTTSCTLTHIPHTHCQNPNCNPLFWPRIVNIIDGHGCLVFGIQIRTLQKLKNISKKGNAQTNLHRMAVRCSAPGQCRRNDRARGPNWSIDHLEFVVQKIRNQLFFKALQLDWKIVWAISPNGTLLSTLVGCE